MQGSKSNKKTTVRINEELEHYHLNSLNFYLEPYIKELVFFINKQEKVNISNKLVCFFYSYLIKAFKFPLYFDQDLTLFIHETYNAYICFYTITKNINNARNLIFNIKESVLKKKQKNLY